MRSYILGKVIFQLRSIAGMFETINIYFPYIMILPYIPMYRIFSELSLHITILTILIFSIPRILIIKGRKLLMISRFSEM